MSQHREVLVRGWDKSQAPGGFYSPEKLVEGSLPLLSLTNRRIFPVGSSSSPCTLSGRERPVI